MKTKLLHALPAAAGLATLALAGTALANDADKAACAMSAEGDDCVRSDGDPGTCVPDTDEPDVLTCDDGPEDGAADDGGGDDGGPDDGDDLACVGLGEGDACIREDGSDGTCQPDVSDPGTLECEDGPDDGMADDGGPDSDDDDDDDDDDNKVACMDLVEGEMCVRPDGDAGTCVPDDSDPGELECEDEAGMSSRREDGFGTDDIAISCSFDRSGGTPAVLGLLMLLGLVRRRR